MDGLSLKERYGAAMEKANKRSSAASIIDETNVYQEINPYAREMMDNMVRENLLPGSRLEGREHFKDFFEQIKAGKHGLMLSEHYSNLDLPAVVYLLEHDGSDFGAALGRDLVAIAGMKLNEDDYRVKSMAEAYTRIVIYPGRRITESSANPEHDEMEARGRKINMAAARKLELLRKEGRPVIVFPSGTRYRPGKPETKRGLRGIDAYLRMFDIMLLISINGQCLHFDPKNPEDMMSDRMSADKMIVAASPVMECKQFRKDAFAESEGKPDVDQKQYTIDKIMNIIEAQHERYEKIRLE